jgi:hypothetical protein
MRCVERDIRERPFEAGPRYEAFLDASSGRHDSLTLAIAHGKGQRVLLDVAYEWVAPFNPIEVTAEVAKALSRYRLTSVYGDSYAVGWVAAELKSNGINLRKAERDKSEIFLDGLPLLTSASVVLLDNQELITQLVNLQREVGKTGRDRIVKMRGFKDDLANAVMGAAVQVGLKRTESFAGEMDIDWAYGGAGTGRRQPKVLLGYAHSKPHAQQGWQDPFYRRKTKAELIELRRQPTTAPIDKHYVGPAGHYLDAVGNDGREQWGRYSPDGMLLGLTWGKEEAEAALTVVITNGKRSV